jgi:molybdenum cofactor cytidylyltransferase
VIAGLILAAGESSRMGRDKALLIYHGRTFLETIIAALRAAGAERIAVVLGHHAEEIQSRVKLTDVEVVVNREYRRGQTSSLQAGLAALEESRAIILCLVDHPAITVHVMKRLLEAFDQPDASVVIPTFQGQRGHPVVIGRRLFPELLALSPDAGANSIIRKYRDATQFVEVEEPGILLDIDDPETYQRLHQA